MAHAPGGYQRHAAGGYNAHAARGYEPHAPGGYEPHAPGGYTGGYTGGYAGGYTPQPVASAPQNPPTGCHPSTGGWTASGGYEQLLSADETGRVIGRGGEGIKSMREASGATIRIDATTEHPSGSDVRKLRVEGHPAAVQHAVSLIQQRIAAMAMRKPLPA